MFIIAVEGVDGCGKLTQCNLLNSFFMGKGYKSKIISFPMYESITGKEIKSKLTDSKSLPNPKDIALWYAVDRAIYMQKFFHESYLSDLDVLIVNRYVTSNAAYQSVSDISMVEWVFELEYGNLKLPRPTIEVILDMKPEYSSEMLENRYDRDGSKKDVYERDIPFQEKVRKRYHFIYETDRHCKRVMVPCYTDSGIRGVQDIHREVVSLCDLVNLVDW